MKRFYKVRCITNTPPHLKLGKIYEVKDAGNPDFLYVKNIPGCFNNISAYYRFRFEKVENTLKNIKVL